MYPQASACAARSFHGKLPFSHKTTSISVLPFAQIYINHALKRMVKHSPDDNDKPLRRFTEYALTVNDDKKDY